MPFTGVKTYPRNKHTGTQISSELFKKKKTKKKKEKGKRQKKNQILRSREQIADSKIILFERFRT